METYWAERIEFGLQNVYKSLLGIFAKDMSIESFSPTLFSIGSGGVIGFLVGFAIKRVIKILAVIAQIFFGLLLYLHPRA